jgi:hypothetical protein
MFNIVLECRDLDVEDIPDLIRLCNKHKQVLYIEDDTCAYSWLFYSHSEQRFIRDFMKTIKNSKNLSQTDKHFLVEYVVKVK